MPSLTRMTGIGVRVGGVLQVLRWVLTVSKVRSDFQEGRSLLQYPIHVDLSSRLP